MNYIQGEQAKNIYSELERYGQVPQARNVAERNRNFRVWARNNNLITRTSEDIIPEAQEEPDWIQNIGYQELEDSSINRYSFNRSEIENIYNGLRYRGIELGGRTVAEKNTALREFIRDMGYEGPLRTDLVRGWLKDFYKDIEEEYVPHQHQPQQEPQEDWIQNVGMPSEQEIEHDITELNRNSLIRALENDVRDRYLNECLVLKLTLKVQYSESSYTWFETKQKFIPINSIEQLRNLLEQLKNGIIEDNEPATGSDPVMTRLPDISLIEKFEIQSIDPDSLFGQTHWHSRRGNFFPYLVKNTNSEMLKVLKRAQIFHEITDEEKDILKEPCLIYSLRQARISEDVLVDIHNKISNYTVQAVKINELFQEFEINGKIMEIKQNGDTRSIVNTGDDFTIMLWKNHYFLNFNTGMTKDWVLECLKNPETTIAPNKRWDGKRWKTQNDRTISVLDLLRILFENDQFETMTYGCLEGVPIESRQKMPITKLDYNQEHCCKQLTEDEKPKIMFPVILSKIYFADFETDPTSKHIPFMCCVSKLNRKEVRTLDGPECGKQLLNIVPDKSTIYFHNASYDINFLMPYVSKATVIRKGLRTISATLFIGTGENAKTITIRDFLTLITMPLSKLPTFFHLKGDIKKEKFPYKYYTIARVKRNIGEIDKAYSEEKPTWTASDIEQFKKNIDEIPGCRIDEKHFNMKRYCEFYCKQDVVILRESFSKCQELMKKSFDIDIKDFLTTPAIANHCLERDVLKKVGIYSYGGKVKDYISRAVYGGRCMCAWNKKWHTKIDIYDLDVCSLYPSAMARMFIPKGIPKVLTPEQCHDSEFLKSTDFYIATIHIKSVPKHRALPLIPQRTKTGIEWNDNLPSEGLIQEFSSIFIEDLEKFYPGLEYEVLRGYYWNEGKDYSIQKFIKNIYRKRGIYKLIKEPVNEMYKLIMNSAYGKTIQKFINTTTKIISAEKFNAYVLKHKDQIIDAEVIDGGKTYVVNMKKELDNQFSTEHVGVIVLDMSKRIMNEVICLAEDIGCRIYYQDTDSIHIECSQVPKLAEEYEKIYNRPMLKPSIKLDKEYTIDEVDELDSKYGDIVEQEMGKFHDDFSSKKGKVLCACESIFIRKKMYIDKLKIDLGDFDFQYRMKGIPQQCIELAASEVGFMELYKMIYDGEAITFNLLDVKACFKQSRNYSISSSTSFSRKVASVYEEGNVHSYFNYSGTSK